MCLSCYEEYGSPKIDTPLVRDAIAAVEELHKEHQVGGGLHLVVDNFNVEDYHVAFCERYCKTESEQRVFDLFTKMTVEERASALAVIWKC